MTSEHNTGGAEVDADAHTTADAMARRRHDAREVAEGVGFARLLAMSSLGEQEAIKDRLTGRKEIAAEYPPSSGRTHLTAGHRLARDEEIDMQVAEELELRGYTFEAELRYRRLLHHPAAAARLALLLEAKGFRRESWTLYLRAATERDPGSLLRLAVICRQRGETDWARRLATTASTALGLTALAELHDQAQRFSSARRTESGLCRVDAEPVGATGAQTYALGSLLFVFADRPDLARVAYSSALAEGHSLSAVSLLDIALPRSPGKGNRYLNRMLTQAHEHDGLVDEFPPALPVPFQEPDDGLLTTMGTATVSNLLGAARFAARGTPASCDALDRLGQIAKTITLLRSHASMSCTNAATTAAKQASIQIGAETQQEAQDATGMSTGAALIRHVWHRSDEALRSRTHTTHSDATHGMEEDQNSKAVTGAGAVHRFRTEFRRLPTDELQVLVLKQSGITVDDISEVIDQNPHRITTLLKTSMARLHAGQAGEQQHPGANDLLWTEVETALQHV